MCGSTGTCSGTCPNCGTMCARARANLFKREPFQEHALAAAAPVLCASASKVLHVSRWQ